MPLAVGLALAVSLALSGGGNAAAQQIATPVLPDAQSAQQYVESYFSDIPIMADIASCESHFTQYDADGSVYRGKVNTLDVGVMQINEHYHAATAAALGLDLYTIQGNVAYARYLYDKEGTQPWDSSKPCWGPKSQKDGSLEASLATAQN